MTTWLQAEVERLADTEQCRALAVFDALDEWFQRPDFECSSFVNTLLGVAGVDAMQHTPLGDFGVVRATLEGYADEVGAIDPRETSHQLQILMMGAIVSAGRGDGEAATRARELAELLLEPQPPR